MDEGQKQALFSAIRSLLVVGGTWAVAHGYATDAMVTEIIGAIAVIGPILYGVYQKFEAERLTKVREAKAVNVGIAIADATPGTTPAIAAENVPQIIAAVPPAIPTATKPDILAAVTAITMRQDGVKPPEPPAPTPTVHVD